jgi:hypothetical protein
MIDFERMDRAQAITDAFQGDEASLVMAEQTAKRLASKCLLFMLTECAEPPPVVRLDFMCRREAAGVAAVFTGEMTELGASVLGWKEGGLLSCRVHPSPVPSLNVVCIQALRSRWVQCSGHASALIAVLRAVRLQGYALIIADTIYVPIRFDHCLHLYVPTAP